MWMWTPSKLTDLSRSKKTLAEQEAPKLFTSQSAKSDVWVIQTTPV
jgi:hypothetical protein